MTMAVGMPVMRIHHVLHDFVGLFDVLISFLELGIHCAGVVAGMVIHGRMVVTGKKSEHAFHSLHGDLGLISSTMH